MTRLDDLAKVVRSKNAGIGLVTVDVVCAEADAYAAIKARLTPERVARAYGVSEDALSDIVYFDEGRAIKVVFERTRIAGGIGLGETDLYGSGQYAPLLDL